MAEPAQHANASTPCEIFVCGETCFAGFRFMNRIYCSIVSTPQKILRLGRNAALTRRSRPHACADPNQQVPPSPATRIKPRPNQGDMKGPTDGGHTVHRKFVTLSNKVSSGRGGRRGGGRRLASSCDVYCSRRRLRPPRGSPPCLRPGAGPPGRGIPRIQICRLLPFLSGQLPSPRAYLRPAGTLTV